MQPQVKPLVMIMSVALMAGLSTLAVIMVTRLVGGPSLSISQISTNKESTFDVMGESKIPTIPDQAEVRLGIVVNEASVKTAQDKANTIINDINKNLGDLGIEKKDIQTDNYSLHPNYDYTAGSVQRITGYSVNTNLVVTLKDFSKLNQVIDMATGAGANQVGGITFTLSDDKKDEIEEDARKQAIDDAKDKANNLAHLAGMRLGKIVNVTENQGSSVQPLYFRESAASFDAKASAAGAPTNVEPGSTTFTYRVTLSYETL